MTVGRNDPCPCGSGRKYKKCHLAADTAAAAAARHETASPLHALDNHLVSAMLEYGGKKFAEEFLDEAEALDSHPEMTMQFAAPWLVFHAPMQGRPVVDWFLEERGRSLSSGERDWLSAQRRSWLSVWEVRAVEPGLAITLRDLLTFEERRVHEVSASQTAQRHYALLGRVVDADGVSVICGMHPIPLRPRSAAPVIERVRKVLRRKTAVSPERLRDPRILRRMLDAWSDEIDHARTPPRLQNTDGDDLLLTEDRWIFDPAMRSELLTRMASIDGAHAEEPDDPQLFTFLRAGNRMHKEWDTTVVGHAELGDGVLRVETNSIARADALRERIEKVCAGRIRQHIRSHSDPAALLDRKSTSPPAPVSRQRTPEENAMVREMKDRHYATWLNDPIPALDGKTPREAARTKSGREKLDALLKDLEITEAHEPESARFNVRRLREALGLARGK